MRFCFARVYRRRVLAPVLAPALAGPVRSALMAVLSLWLVCAAAAPALAQQCVGLASAPSRVLVQPASLRLAQKSSQAPVRVTFVGHATFMIESPQGIRIATDYNDYVRSPIVPDIATMNIAHDSHFSRVPDPRITHVLPGWNPKGGAAEHDLQVGDVHVRNIPTNIRDWSGGTREFGNSIFVFEVAGLCIAHLGHLHHTLTVQQIGQIGQMDVLLVPVDGGMTLDLEGMTEVLKALNARVMIPMHMFSAYGLERFLRRVRQEFEVVESPVPTVTISRATLPPKPQVLVLPGR
jgi:L-ascorbate metabolism protein UlaG (beta-lactamase superfamily)